jgi:hypothetical protein
MKILAVDAETILYELDKGAARGEDWLSYMHPGKETLLTQSIETWKSRSEVQEYCEDLSASHAGLLVAYAAIEPFREELKKAMDENKISPGKTLEVDMNHVNTASQQITNIDDILGFGKNELVNTKNLSIMNEKNLEYLNKQIKYAGFGEGHQEALKEKIEQGQTDFALFHQADFGKDSAVATLQFKKGDESDMYFFNRYNLMLKGPQHEDPLKQTFYINNKGDNITLKEAYNLMSGRAVHKELSSKEGEKYQAWIQLDFKNIDKHGNYEMKKYHQNYGFDLEKALAKQPIKELGNETDKTRLMESLQKGNRQAVTLQHNGNEKQVFVEAAPQFKSLNFYDSSMKRLTAQSLNEKQAEGQTEKKEEKKETVKQEKNGPDEEGNSKKQSQGKSKRKGQSV